MTSLILSHSTWVENTGGYRPWHSGHTPCSLAFPQKSRGEQALSSQTCSPKQQPLRAGQVTVQSGDRPIIPRTQSVANAAVNGPLRCLCGLGPSLSTRGNRGEWLPPSPEHLFGRTSCQGIHSKLNKQKLPI